MLSIAENKRIKNAIFIKADAADLPFTEQSFSAIVSVTMLEFVKDLKKVMEEIDRILITGGHLVLGCLNALSELGKNKYNDQVYKHARFFTPADVEHFLSHFGTPQMSYGVYYSPEFELLDGTENQDSVEPAFIAASVKKIN
jgi:ubiquinone/menaquinone biosynthesis C-methylase UbiE